MNDLRVLCVENQPSHMDTLKSMLETAGYEVMPATTGGQALQLLTTLPIDGVLLEYDLPDATGSAVRNKNETNQARGPRPVICRCRHPDTFSAPFF